MTQKTVFAALALALMIGCSEDGQNDEPILVIDDNNTVANNTTNNANNANSATNNATNNAANNTANNTANNAANNGAVDTVFGKGGGADTIALTLILAPNVAMEGTDLEFHPTRDELWVMHRRYEADGVCGQGSGFNARCASLGSVTTVIFNAGKGNQRAQYLEDENSWHFMRRAPAIAMGANDTFGTCGEAATGNFEDDPVMYIGPTLWPSDLAVYAQPSGLNGSHLDMLHATPWCMGIAHERDNVYWLFNGHVGSIDRYDFKADHGPGAEDHSDGTIHRYVEGSLSRTPNVPSHMQFDGDKWLYVVDTGNARVVRLDTTSGTKSGGFAPIYEQVADYGSMSGAMLEDVITTGLEAPSGLALHDGKIYVSDNATSKIHAFDMSGTWLASVDTGLPPGSLAGIEVGPENRLWLSDLANGKVYRIDPK